MALGNGALPLRGTEGKESRVDFLAAVTANSILDYTLEILERICIVCVGGGRVIFPLSASNRSSAVIRLRLRVFTCS